MGMDTICTLNCIDISSLVTQVFAGVIVLIIGFILSYFLNKKYSIFKRIKKMFIVENNLPNLLVEYKSLIFNKDKKGNINLSHYFDCYNCTKQKININKIFLEVRDSNSTVFELDKSILDEVVEPLNKKQLKFNENLISNEKYLNISEQCISIIESKNINSNEMEYKRCISKGLLKIKLTLHYSFFKKNNYKPISAEYEAFIQINEHYEPTQTK